MIRPETRAAYGFLSPWVIGFLGLTLGPVVATFVMSFSDYDVLSSTQWVGTENYRDALDDPHAHAALKNTFFYTALYVPLSIGIALGLALLLQSAGRLKGVFRTLIYLPVVTPPVATGVLFLQLLNGQTGLINNVLGNFALPTPNWTTDPMWIKPGIVIMSLWSVGSVTLILFAALAEVPAHLREAALVDGAGAWRRFYHITLPMISPAIFFSVVVNTIASLQLFSEVYTMYFGATTTPPPEEALFYVVYLFEQAFRDFEMGYAAALSWLLFLIIMAITAVQLAVSRRLVHYRSD